MTQWLNVITGERLDRATLDGLRRKARRAYEANTHIFEDELDALAAFGVVPSAELDQTFDELVAAVA
jgi:hypothetical protein